MDLGEFFLLISLLVANKDKKEKEFMHAHSRTVFDLLDEDGSGTITIEEFQRLGFLFNLHHREIRSIFKDFDISGDDALDSMFLLNNVNRSFSISTTQSTNVFHKRYPCQTKASIEIDLFARKDSSDNEAKSSDVFDSIYIPQTRATRSIKSQSFSRHPYSSSNK